MHNVGIVHRDLQPSNIIFDEQGFIRVCDFNSSVVLSLQKDGRAYSTVGCPFYMSPEVIKNRGHGFAADWWSLGCIVFEMLTGYPPFYDVNRLGCYQKVLALAPNPSRVTSFFYVRFCWDMWIFLRLCILSQKILLCPACAATKRSASTRGRRTSSAATSYARTRGSRILTGILLNQSLLFRSGSQLRRFLATWICGTEFKHEIGLRARSHTDCFRYSSDVEAAPFADEYVTTGAAVTGSKKDSFIDF